MMLDIFAKVQEIWSMYFFLTCATGFKWIELMQAVAGQYDEHLSVDQIQNLSVNEKSKT